MNVFGYVTPYKQELKVWEFEEYRGLYCGLCKTIGREYGWVPRMFLNYDYVFLALLLQELSGQPGKMEPHRCVVHPTCKRPMCAANATLSYVSGLSVLLVYHKMQDNLCDSVWWKKAGFLALKWLLTPAYRRAQRKYPVLEQHVCRSIAQLTEIEHQKSENLDQAAATFADMMREVAQEGAAGQQQKRIAGAIGQELGRWIYIMDAFSDIEQDLGQGSYNPLLYRFAYRREESVEQFRGRIAGQVDFTLVQSLSVMYGAFELMQPGRYHGILKNIILLGLASRQREIMGKQKGEEDDGPL